MTTTGKVFHETMNVGKCKYIVNFHDGEQTHRDGSAFYDIRIFSNKATTKKFVKSLLSQGYKER